MINYDNYQLRIDKIIDRFSLMFFKDPNVISVGRGNKIINGEMCNYPTLTIIVKKKIDSNLLHPLLVIPKTINGVATDVLEKSDLVIKSPSNNNLVKKLITADGPPAMGGGCIVVNGGGGTLTYAVTERVVRKNIYFLASAHVLEETDGSFKKGKPVMYAKEYTVQSIKKGWMLGTIERGVLVKRTKTPAKNDPYQVRIINRIDAGLGLVGPNNNETKRVIVSGLTNGKSVTGIQKFDEIKVGSKVYKVGMTTGYTEGTIMMLNSMSKVGVDDSSVSYFKNQIVVKIAGGEGDSGSLGVMIQNGKAFGMLNSGTDDVNKFSDINYVLKDLDIELL